MQLSFDPRNQDSIEKAMQMLGIASGAGAGEAELKRLVDSLRDTIKKKNMEIASLMAVSGILGVDYEKVLSAPAADEAEEERKKPVTPERHGMDSVRQTEGSGPL